MRAAWDPRIGPNLLKTRYGYDANGLLTSIGPPGLNAWTVAYDAAQQGRVSSVSRPSPQGTLTWSVAYGVALSGSGLPDVSAGTAATGWGQSDTADVPDPSVPGGGTAIFPPGHSPGSGYDGATIRYLDIAGRVVNTASQQAGLGWQVATSEYDGNDNLVRTVSATNRRRMLADASKKSLLDTRMSYDPADPTHTDLVRTLGPEHTIRVAGSATTVRAREQVDTAYSDHLATDRKVSALVAGQLQDTRETTYDYSGAGGSVARAPTTTTVKMGAGNPDLVTLAAYDAATGQPTSSTMPAGGSARTTFTRYYTAGAGSGDGACENRPWYAGLPCKDGPVAQPTGGLPTIPTTTRLYDRLGQPTVESDALKDGDTRATTTSYDAAGRVTGTSVSASSGVADAVPSTSQAYEPDTGLPSATTAAGKTLTKAYDSLGRVTGYTDADGVTSTTSYDSRGRVSHTEDGKGSQDLGYDATSDQLTTLTDSAAGVFTAGYDADGQPTQQAYPNGLQATTTYDETGDPTRLAYVKTSNCASSCTWLDEQVDSSIHGQWLHRTSTLSGQDYAYDQAGRLTRVDDTDIKGNKPCTQRRYSFDADSNRTGQVAGASCADGSGGTNTSHGYDEADRLTDTATGYDKLGNTTALSAANAGGYAITSTYYADDRLHTQTQNGITETQDLDPARRIRQLTVAGQTTRVDTYHYSDEGDSPAWISSAPGSWTRNIQGPGGDLAATQDGATGTVTLQLSHLHGDIIATASTSATATGPTGTQEQTEFGEPRTPSLLRYGYLGAKGRQLTYPWGTIQMGQRSYIPQTGRFLQTDPVPGGSANNYDYVNQDPVNQTDLSGEKPRDAPCTSGSKAAKKRCLAHQRRARHRRPHPKRRPRRRPRHHHKNPCGDAHSPEPPHAHPPAPWPDVNPPGIPGWDPEPVPLPASAQAAACDPSLLG